MTVLFRNKKLRDQINDLNQSRKKMEDIKYSTYVIQNSENYSINLLTWQQEEFIKALKTIKDLENEIRVSILELTNPNNNINNE
jgi:hypothetical protein